MKDHNFIPHNGIYVTATGHEYPDSIAMRTGPGVIWPILNALAAPRLGPLTRGRAPGRFSSRCGMAPLSFWDSVLMGGRPTMGRTRVTHALAPHGRLPTLF